MKAISLLLLTLFLGKSCNTTTQKDIATAVIQYTANSRGYHLNIIVANKKASIAQGRGTENPATEVTISEADWDEMVGYFQKVNLKELPNLKDPTQKRFYDGAAIAKLKVRYQDTDYETVDFDHGNPPVEIEKLVNKIAGLAKKEE
jgi:hypothetical protein